MLGYQYKEVAPGQWGFAPTGKEEVVDRCREIAFALADGDLAAADAETATWASSVSRRNVEFDPSLGSE